MRHFIGLLVVGILLQACGVREATPAKLVESKLPLSKITRDNLLVEFTKHVDSGLETVRFEGITGKYAQARFGVVSWSFSARINEETPIEVSMDYTHSVRGEVVLAGKAPDSWSALVKGNGLTFGALQSKFSAFTVPVRVDLNKKSWDVSKWVLLEALMSTNKVEALKVESLDDQKTIAALMMGIVSDEHLRRTDKAFPFYYINGIERIIAITFATPKEGELVMKVVRLEKEAADGKDVLISQNFRLLGI